MTTPEPTLAEQITAAEKAGDWQTARRLKSSQALGNTLAADHDGRLPQSAPATAEPVPAAESAPTRRISGRPVENLQPAVMPVPPGPQKPGIVGALEQQQQNAAPAPTSERVPVEHLHSGGAQLTPDPPTVAEQIATAEKTGDRATARRLKLQQLTEIVEQQRGF